MRSVRRWSRWALALMAAGLAFPGCRSETGFKVEIQKQGDRYRLLRDGSPYFIRGAGGWEYLEELKAAGGNSVRTWGAKTDGEVLDRAHNLGLSVAFGLWLGQVQHGFDYSDPAQVRKQFQELEAIVRLYKDHPALLIWGVGNEMELGPPEAELDPNIWRAVEEVARMIKREDPNHPTMTVIAGVTEEKLRVIRKYCPSLDLLGVNGYGNLLEVPRVLDRAGWDKPFIITEFGPPGAWEVQTTEWGAPLEETSTQKAYTYLSYYRAVVESQDERCLGSYVYFWGVQPRVVQTHTWYETFLPGGGERLGAVDALTLSWAKRLPDNLAPEIVYLQSTAGLNQVRPGSSATAEVIARDPDGDRLQIRWEVRRESPALTGPPPPVVADSEKEIQATLKAGPETDFLDRPIPYSSATGRAVFQVPEEEGPYRLFVYVLDNRGSAATANVPFLVKGSP